MIDFGQCLIAAQKLKAVTSVDLARRVGVHRQQVNIWRNKKNVRLDTAIKVTAALDIGLDDFLARCK